VVKTHRQTARPNHLDAAGADLLHQLLGGLLLINRHLGAEEERPGGRVGQ
jgi:hypothetical protein